MEIYLYVVAATLIFGVLLPQTGRKRIYYIALMTVIHTFFCAFRYEHLTGDLIKYNNIFNYLAILDWFNEDVIQEGRNVGFQLVLKLVHLLSGGNFQMVLIVIAIVVHLVLGYVIYRYSPAPWLSFLVWNCMSFYVFGFNAIKQALAMSFVMLAFVGIAERKLGFFLAMMAIAGSIHMPALVFLPGYWLSAIRANTKAIIFYVFLGIILYMFKNQIVNFIRSFYYEEDEVMMYSGTVGGRFIMITGFTLFGVMLRGFQNPDFEKLFHIMAVAAILQTLSGFDNIFTRLTDYYFQFSVLYLPMTFFPMNGKCQKTFLNPIFPFNNRSLKVFALIVSVFILWFYWNFSGVVGIQVGDTYRFMWE